MTKRGTSYEGTPPAGAAPGQRRVALVIGNGRYARESDCLVNPHKDAKSIAQALSLIGFFGVGTGTEPTSDEFTVDFNNPGVPALLDLRQQQLGRALAALARASHSAAQAVIYYAGHGIEVRGENYLIPVDARLNDASDAPFELQALSRALGVIEGASGLQLVILDACRNNPFRSRLFGGRNISGGLRSFEPPGTSLVAYAAKHGSVASDGRPGSTNSPFAAALLSHMTKPGLEVIDLFREVKDDVLEATDGAQEPHLYGSPGRKREYFVPPQDQDAATPAAASTFAHGTPDWSKAELERLKDSGDISRLQELAKQVNPYYATDVRDLIAALEAKAAREKAEAEQRALEDSNWGWARQQNSVEAYRRFLNAWPNGRYDAEACNCIAVLEDAERARREEEEEERARFGAAEKKRQAKAVTDRYRSEGRIQIAAPNIHGAPDGWFKPGKGKTEWFKDLDAGPEMVVVPAGSFMMGSPADEPEREAWESPHHEVTIAKPLAVSRCAITFDEWDAYVAEVGRGFLGIGGAHRPKDKGWGRGRRPVINVSWDDVQTYIAWLSDKAGRPYRLLSEAEWEYVARAGTVTPFWWGSAITTEQANYCGHNTYEGGGEEGIYRGRSVPVDSFDANPWGLYNVHGNVSEWCKDFWHDSYSNAPEEGSAWLKGGESDVRVARGGCWLYGPGEQRSAFREGGALASGASLLVSVWPER